MDGVALRCEITGDGFATDTVTNAELFGARFGSSVSDATDAVFVIAASSAVRHATLTASVNCAAAPFVSVAAEHVTVPVLPIVGVVHVHPGGAVSDLNTVADGRTSL